MNGRPAYNMRYIWLVTLVSAMGGLLFGYDWVVIGGAKPFYEKFFNLTTPSQIGWAMSSALVGCLVGALVSGGLSDRFGRKKLLILAGLFFTVSAVVDRAGRGFHRVRRLPPCRRHRHRPGLQPLPDVHRRDLPGRDPGQVRLGQPADHRHRHPGRPAHQLAHRPPRAAGRHGGRHPGLLERPDGLALDVRGRGRARGPLLPADVPGPGEPPLAGQERPRRGGREGPGPGRRSGFRRRGPGRHPGHAGRRRDRPGPLPRPARAGPAPRSCSSASSWPSISSGAASTSSSITPRRSSRPRATA